MIRRLVLKLVTVSRSLFRGVRARTPAPVRRIARPAAQYAQLATIVRSKTFDQEWYEAQRGRQFNSMRGAVVDYLRRPRKEYLSPHPLFEPEWFDGNEWKSRRLDPLVWFLRSEQTLNRSPHPLLEHWMASGRGEAGVFAATHWPELVRSLAADTALPVPPGYREVRWGDLRSALLAEAARWRRDMGLVTAPRRQATWAGSDQAEGVDLDQSARGVVSRSPTVSVVLPTWNRAPLVARAIASVQAQTFSDFEVIVVDDGSTDDTARILRRVCKLDSRVRTVSIDHAGVCAARNRGIAEVRGEFVAFLDSDNTWEPGYLRAMVSAMQRERWDLAHAVLRAEDDGAGFYRAFEGTRDHLLVANYIDINVLMIRATLLRKVGGFDPTLRRVVDWDLVLRLSLHADLHLVPVIGAVYSARSSDSKRISVSELVSWGGVVRARHLIDWESVAAADHVNSRVSVALPFRSALDSTLRWVDAVRNEALNGRDVELCMVSSGARRAHRLVAASLAHALPWASLTATPKNVGFAVATDLALANATGSIFVVARPNLAPFDGWLAPLVETLGQGGVAAVQSLVLRPDGTVASAGGVFAGATVVPEPLLNGFPEADVRRIGEVFPVPAALSGVLAMRTADAVSSHGFDPLLGDSMVEVDLSLRLAEAGRGKTMLDARSRAREVASTRTGFGNDVGLAARVLTARWGSPPPGSRKLWESAGFIVDGYREVELTSSSGNTGRALRVVLRRRQPHVTVHECPPRLRWTIDTAAPAGARGELWGDTHFARSLARALTDRGQEVAIDAREARNRDTRRFDDVVLVLRGLNRVQPSAGAVSILWVISHPDDVDGQELRLYDRVFAASRAWTARASASWGVDARPLLQCTDPEFFNPDRAEPDTGPPVLFVGNSRKVDRPVIRHAVATGADVWIYGGDWDGLVDASCVKGPHVANHELGALYASAGIVLNDHWGDMRRHGFLSNRLFDATACGARVVSDEVVGIGEVFGDTVRTFDSPRQLEVLLTSPWSRHFPDRQSRRESARKIMEEHSFARRAEQLVDAASRAWFERQREPSLRRANGDLETLRNPPDRTVLAPRRGRTPGIPLPPVELRAAGPIFQDDGAFVASAKRDVATLQRYARLTSGSRVLDWGCGAGRLAVGIKHVLGNVADYHGVDVQPALIAWARNHLSDDATRFTNLNHRNERYNPGGELDYTLPAEPGSVDVVNAYSVFSHMLPADILGYARTVARILAPEGRFVTTAFVEDGVPDWEENPPGYGVLQWTGRLHCVRYERQYFESLLSDAGLAVETFIYGQETDGQSLYSLRAEAPS